MSGERRGKPHGFLLGPGVCYQGSRGWDQGLFLHCGGCTALVITRELRKHVAKLSPCSTVAFSELSSGLHASHPPTLAASCLQTDLLVNGENQVCRHFCQGKSVFLEERQWGLSLNPEKKILFKKIRFPRPVCPSCYYCVLFEDRNGLPISRPEEQV